MRRLAKEVNCFILLKRWALSTIYFSRCQNLDPIYGMQYLQVKNDAYIPRNNQTSPSDIWPGCTVEYIDSGHVGGSLKHQDVFRRVIWDTLRKLSWWFVLDHNYGFFFFFYWVKSYLKFHSKFNGYELYIVLFNSWHQLNSP